MRKGLALFLAAALCLTPALAAPQTQAGAAVLMEKETGTILYEEHSHDRLEPASVTKIMTLLLTMEAIDAGELSMEETVRASARAASMGGSQVYLKEGEELTVRDLLKAVAVVSGNDAAVALAERMAGSEGAFVERMNRRAAELGMTDTTFRNCTGLPYPGHLTSAYDIALMSRELILRHPAIREFTTIWTDSLRNGAFQLSNTNRLVRYYEGCTGLKTGSTDAALYCLSATAERQGMELIAVVLKAPTSDQRFQSARELLDYGFGKYTLFDPLPGQVLAPVKVLLGEEEGVMPVAEAKKVLLEQGQEAQVEVSLPQEVEAPVERGQRLGELRVKVGEQVQAVIPLTAERGVERLSLWGIFRAYLGKTFKFP